MKLTDCTKRHNPAAVTGDDCVVWYS